MRRIFLALIFTVLAGAAPAGTVGGTFDSIDGGEISLEALRGQPVLVVNTASRCGFTGQYDDLQALYDRYRDRGLVVLAVPSDDFGQELQSEAAVKDFCELNFDLDMPMTTITHVRGDKAHPFYQSVRAETGFEPRWNFNKILIGPDGEVAASWGALTSPGSRQISRQIDTLLN